MFALLRPPIAHACISSARFASLTHHSTSNHLLLQTTLSINADGNLILRSWGWTYAPHPNEGVFLNELGNTVRDEMIASGGQAYQSITGADLYPVTGAHDDWASGNRDADTLGNRKFVGHGWCLELRGNSFILDPSNIVPTGEEIVVAMKAYMQFLLERFGDSP